MNLFELFVKVGVDDQASDKLSGLSSKLGNGLKTAAKIGTAAVGAAAAGITALTTAAVNNYAEYEQLVGGVETLFKGSSDKVQEYAANAYKTAGMSANEYMSTVTSFSASLLQSLGGDTEVAAKYADTAVTDMADNANKMGTSIDMLQNAYSGFAKQNFTMLDNLKLGYGGTKEEMQRLLDDAEKLSGVEYDISSFADITEAIHVMQENMGIAGATALEAGTTIEGSVNSMKGAWQNLLTGLADGNADIGQLVDNLVTTIVGDGTESNLGVLGNILPAVRTALTGASTLVSELIPQIVQIIPSIITDNLPILAEAAISIIQSLVDGISENQEMLMTTAMETITYLATSLISMLPQIVQLGLDLIVSLANGIAESLPELIPTIVDVILQIVDTLTDPETLSSLIDASIAIIIALAEGLINSLPKLIEKAPTIISNLVTAIVNNAPKLLVASVEVIKKLATGIIDNLPQIGQVAGEIIGTLFNGIMNLGSALWNIGSNIVSGIWNGIVDNFDVFYENVKGFFSGIIGGVKNILGIHSPSRVFAGIGENMALGLGEGWNDEFGNIKKDIQNGMNFGVATVGVDSSAISRNNYDAVSHGIDKPITIIVQSVLDGKVIGETAYNYNRRKARAGGI